MRRASWRFRCPSGIRLIRARAFPPVELAGYFRWSLRDRSRVADPFARVADFSRLSRGGGPSRKHQGNLATILQNRNDLKD